MSTTVSVRSKRNLLEARLKMDSSRLTELQRKLAVYFSNPGLLQQALIHRSFLNENPGFTLGSNERLEFLGDAVLGLVVAERLFREYPDLPEGDLTSLRSALVRTQTLARVAERLSLGEYLYMGKGEESSGGRQRPLTLARAMEALIGAIYLDQGLTTTQRLVWQLLEPELTTSLQESLTKDYKSRLQEFAQAERGTTPVYRTVSAVGPSHAMIFTVEVLVGNEVLGHGTGRTKQAAEQEAARVALETLRGQHSNAAR